MKNLRLIEKLFDLILIITGILIALAINNWNEERKDRAEEFQILLNLKEELFNNKESIDLAFKSHRSIYSASSVLLQLTGLNPNLPDNAVVDSLIGRSTMSITFDHKNGVLIDLLSSGKLSLIRNRKLRTLLAEYPGLISDIQRDEDMYKLDAQDKYLEYLADNISLVNMDKHSYRPDLDKSEFDINYKVLFSSLKFENLLQNRNAYADLALKDYIPLQDVLESMISIVEKELN